MAGMMFVFWLLFQTKQEWVSVAFYIWGLILGILLISQFWTLANAIYDPRQAKRLFGFIGGGVTLGGMTGAGLTALIIERVGANTLLLWSAFTLVACALLVSVILGKEHSASTSALAAAGQEEKGVRIGRALQLLRESRQVQLIALVIGFGSLGAALIDQQLSMAAEGLGQEETIGKFLAQVRFGLSAAAMVIQVWLTPRIHRYLGIGFALLMLPVNLGATAIGIIMTRILWAPAVASIFDRSLRYTVDKTTREVLFLPLPATLRQDVKPFVDVTVDRMSRAFGAFMLLLLIKPWGLHLQWHQLSFVSLGLMAIWLVVASRAKREYLQTFRRSIEHREVQAEEVRLNVADLSTIETLVEELASPDERRVLYAIELLEALDKRNLITPLLLHHESEQVRVRALAALGSARAEIAERWVPAVQRMLKDSSADVRVAAVRALASMRQENVVELMRPYLEDQESRLAATAATVLADSTNEDDVSAAETTLMRLAGDTRQAEANARREVAAAIAHIKNPTFRHLLIPLIYDANIEVAQEAIRSARTIGSADALFVPALVSLQRHRLLKPQAREVLVGYGEEILDVLGYFLRDQDEDIWVRRHIPSTLAAIPCQKSMDLLVAALQDPDGFLRYKAICAIEKLRRENSQLTFDRQPIESLALREASHYYEYLKLRFNFLRAHADGAESLLTRALNEKLQRTLDRIYRLLGLMYPWKDISAARWAIEHAEARERASAFEYLDNLIAGNLRKAVMPIVEDMPVEEKVRRGSAFLRERSQAGGETLAQLIDDEDQVVASAAIHYVEEKRLWQFVPDLEHSLEFRPAKDWYLFEAASWALAAYRLPLETRRALWMEPLPAVELANRLRSIPLFEFVSVDELFRISGIGRQVRHEAGRVLYHQGSAAEMLQFLLDGKVAMGSDAGESHEIEAPAALAFYEVLEGSPVRVTLQAVDTVICLALNGEEFLTLLSENSPIAQGLFRMLLGGTAAASWRSFLKGEAPEEVRRLAANRMTPVEKVLVLQQVPIFARITAEQLLALAKIAHLVPIAAGSPLFEVADRAAIFTMLSGQVRLEQSGVSAPTTLTVGDATGVYETLAGQRTGARAQVIQPGAVLRIDREELFDVLGDHTALQQGLFSAMLHAGMAQETMSSTASTRQ
jgi:HEAT repeat protein